ncbi:zinc finger protein RFP-like isoform X4 [Sminthopsis crassicaudata]|uniref:zinc finger protein RFP-like isoform X4 n=1 Tax=Sminthopsis crassicaudata TaxID=9301 RepID=UPI003D69E0F0
MDFPTKLCAKHRETLKLLCQEDQRCICMVCHAIQLHTAHHLPRDEAVQDCLDKLSTQLTFLKTEKEEALETKLSGEQEIQGMLNLVSVEMQKVTSNFNKIQEFLKDQEKSLVLQMEELNRDITEWKEKFTTQLSKKVSYLSNLVAELEEQHWNPVLKLPESRDANSQKLQACASGTERQNPAPLWEELGPAEEYEAIQRVSSIRTGEEESGADSRPRHSQLSSVHLSGSEDRVLQGNPTEITLQR